MLPTSSDRATFSPPPIRWRSRSFIWVVLGVVAVLVAAVCLLQAPNVIPRLAYDLHPAVTPTPAPVAAVSPGATPVPVPADPTITIPKLGVTAPVVYLTSTKETDVLKALQNGVIHYATTALPGQVGNVAIFGHSSNDWWQPGNYKHVFVLLDKLVPGDQVQLTYNSVRYTYEVTGSKVVLPTAMYVLDATATPTLSLITCTPVGTSLKRLVVTAKQISPAPGAAAAAVAASPTPVPAPDASSSTTLVGSQGAGTSFWNVVVSGFNSVFHRP